MSVVISKKTCLITVSEQSVPELPKAVILTGLVPTGKYNDYYPNSPAPRVKETAPARGYLLRPPCRTPDGGGLVSQPGVPCARHRQAQSSLSCLPVNRSRPAEPLPDLARHNGTGGLQFSVLVQRHQALFSFGALCVFGVP